MNLNYTKQIILMCDSGRRWVNFERKAGPRYRPVHSPSHSMMNLWLNVEASLGFTLKTKMGGGSTAFERDRIPFHYTRTLTCPQLFQLPSSSLLSLSLFFIQGSSLNCLAMLFPWMQSIGSISSLFWPPHLYIEKSSYLKIQRLTPEVRHRLGLIGFWLVPSFNVTSG